MGKLTLEVKAVMDWVSNDSFREAVLIAEAPIKPSSFYLMTSGRYVPSARMIRDLNRVMKKYAHGIIITPVSNIAHR